VVLSGDAGAVSDRFQQMVRYDLADRKKAIVNAIWGFCMDGSVPSPSLKNYSVKTGTMLEGKAVFPA